jgi:hypothetical protein
MPFTIVYKGQTISAADFNDNFYHIAQGDFLPRGGNSLEATTGVYDLGSVSYKWNNVHVQNVNLNGELQGAMNLISEVTLTTTSTVIEFTGLNGETDQIYEIIVNGIAYATGTSRLYLNSDSTANNYGYQYIFIKDVSISAQRLSTISGIGILTNVYDTITAGYGKNKIICYANNTIKLLLSDRNDSVGDTYIRDMYKLSWVWNNSATLTSLKFTGHFDPGTNIQLWALR